MRLVRQDIGLLMLVPTVLFIIAGVAETNRAPFDLPEAESEIVAGFHTEYSGFRFALYFLAEYANIFVLCGVAVTVFFGGWLRPFPNVGFLEIPMNVIFPILLFVLIGAGCAIGAMRVMLAYEKGIMAVLALGMFLIAALFAIPPLNEMIIGFFWFLFKVLLLVYMFIWFRGTLPRFRYDQLMQVGWKYLIPISMGGLIVNGIVLLLTS